MSIPGLKGEGAEKQPPGRRSPDWDRPNMSNLRIVLVGKTGAGKSSSGNTILGRKIFKAAKSGSSITKVCQKETECVEDRWLVVVDTPGIFDNVVSESDLKAEINKCINMTAPGPHAIILVIQPGPFTEEESLSVEKIIDIFGKAAEKYTMILFTHGDELTEPIEKQLSEAGEKLKHLIDLYGGRYHVFNNTRMEDRSQVQEFLCKVEDMVSANGGKHYANEMFTLVELMLNEREAELKKQYEESERKLTDKYTEEISNLQKEIESLQDSEHKKDKEIERLKQLIKDKNKQLEDCRHDYDKKRKTARLHVEETEVDENVEVKVSRAMLKNLRV